MSARSKAPRKYATSHAFREPYLVVRMRMIDRLRLRACLCATGLTSRRHAKRQQATFACQPCRFEGCHSPLALGPLSRLGEVRMSRAL
jgi:hypothetical protein